MAVTPNGSAAATHETLRPECSADSRSRSTERDAAPPNGAANGGSAEPGRVVSPSCHRRVGAGRALPALQRNSAVTPGRSDGGDTEMDTDCGGKRTLSRVWAEGPPRCPPTSQRYTAPLSFGVTTICSSRETTAPPD